MIHHHLHMALLNMKQNKLYAAINIIGLSLAFCAALLIALYVRDELSYESWLPDYEQIYRVSAGVPGRRTSGAGPSELGQWVALDFSEAQVLARYTTGGSNLELGETTFNMPVTWADSNFFEVFQLPVVAGSLDGALDEPGNLVLTKRIAEIFFPDVDPIGKVLTLDKTHPMTVVGVIENLPSNTHLRFVVIAPAVAEYSPLSIQDRTPLTVFGQKVWSSFSYLKVSSPEEADRIQAGLADMLDRRAPMQGPRPSSEIWELTITSIKDIHLSPLEPDGRSRDLSQIISISAIGLLILMAAGVNFINMMTARGIARAREIGVRKTLGADRMGLVAQFMTETQLYVLVATVLSLFLAYFLMPVFNSFLLRDIGVDLVEDFTFLAQVIMVAVMIGVLAGIYPSLVLSSYSAGVVMQAHKSGRAGSLVRQGLTVIQFSILIALMIGTLVINRQVQFGVDEALRQNADPIVTVNTPCMEPLRNAVLALPGTLNLACSVGILQFGIGPGSGMQVQGEQGRNAGVNYASVDDSYFDLYGISIVAGRGFDRERSTDHSPPQNVWTVPEPVVINESAARELGYDTPQDAIGDIVGWAHYFRLAPPEFSPRHEAEIIGVVEDFQFGSIRQDIRPAAFYMDLNQSRAMSIRINGQVLPETLEGIDRAWEEFGQPRPIQRAFFDQQIANMYRDLTTQGDLLAMYAGIAILISILGLVGLAAFVAQRRTKEIGVRKVLGGKRRDIITLLLWQFAKPVVWANLIAWPTAWYFINLWLEGFARQIDLEAWMFTIPALLALGIALATVFTHAFYMSNADPVKSLRYE